ncbi:MAG: hypothetical protein ACHRHE_14805 [Tepidisphaerales bacterium]
MTQFHLITIAFFAALPAIAQPATQPADGRPGDNPPATEQSTTQPTTQPYETPPDRLIHIQKDAEVEVLGFSDDGNTLYLYAGVTQLNIGGLLLYYWPEAAAILVVLILLRWLVRVARRPQFPGEEHCRRCNYLLKNLPSARCPECGTELTPRNRLPGRRRWPRMVIASILILAAATAWLCTKAHLPREGTVGNWLNWRSIRLGEWAAAASQEWANRHLDYDDLVLLADVKQGSFRKVCRIENRIRNPVLSPDRKSVFGWYWEPTEKARFGGGGGGGRRGDGGFGGIPVSDMDSEIAQVDLSTGTITKRIPKVAYDYRFNPSIHITPLGCARVLFVRSSNWESRVQALDIETGRTLNNLNLDHDIDRWPEMRVLTDGGHDIAVVWTVSFARDKAPPAAPVFGQGGSHFDRPVGTKNVRAWDPATGKILSGFSVTGDWCTSDAGKFYMSNDTDAGVVLDTWDIFTGKKLASGNLTGPKAGRLTVRHNTLILQTPTWESAGDPLDTSEAHALNLKTGEHTRWVLDELAEPVLSRDGRRLAVLQRHHRGDVCIYNLP